MAEGDHGRGHARVAHVALMRARARVAVRRMGADVLPVHVAGVVLALALKPLLFAGREDAAVAVSAVVVTVAENPHGTGRKRRLGVAGVADRRHDALLRVMQRDADMVRQSTDVLAAVDHAGNVPRVSMGIFTRVLAGVLSCIRPCADVVCTGI